MATGIPPSVWIDEGEEAMATADELLRERNKTAGPGGPRLSG